MNKVLSLLIASAFIFLVITNPKICTAGAAKGLILSGRVIIPSLFPFTACVLFIMKSGGLDLLDFISPFTKKIFHLSSEQFSLMLLSFIGGYPVGAKLLNESVRSGRLSKENAGIMLNYCVNAGPAFIILAVGSEILGSKKIGYILLSAHLIASLILSLILSLRIKNNCVLLKAKDNFDVADNFVSSVSEAASSVFSVCAYVILFSTVNEYLNHFCEKIPVLKSISSLLEVTNAVTNINNIIIIAFLLGFSGISVWCQILSVGKLIKINFPLFVLSRIAHGALSALICAILLKLFGIAVKTSAGIKYAANYDGTTLSISMLSMVIVLIISLFSEKRTGNIFKDIV